MNEDQEIHEAMLERELDPDFALISDFVCGELPEAKAAEVRARLETDPDFRELAEPLLLAYSVPPKTKPLSHEELVRAWLQVRRRAGMPAVPGQNELDEREELSAYYERQRRERARESRSQFLKVASIFIVLMGISIVGIWWQRAHVGPAAPPAQAGTEEVRTFQSVSVQLPDGSSARLANATVMRYPSGFVGGRRVHLVGEGRFDVVPGSGPFYVTTESAEIMVLGTSFTVRAYRDQATIVTVVEGTVRVAPLMDRSAVSRKVGKVVVLNAGQAAQIERNSQPEILP
jgi:transmembrane sensor